MHRNIVLCVYPTFKVSHIEATIGNNNSGDLQQNLDPCWNETDMIHSAVSIYELSISHLLVKNKTHRANMNNVVEQIEKIISK